MTNEFIVAPKIGSPIFCIVDGDVSKHFCCDYTNNGTDFQILTEDEELFILGEDVFASKKEAVDEIRNRLLDC